MSTDHRALVGRGLTHSFEEAGGRKTILRDASLELCRGQLTAIMGPSGSGKTTLVGILAGLLRPDQGEVLALGQPLWEMSEVQRRAFRLAHCGFVFQGHNLFPALTARQQLEIVLRWGRGRRGSAVRRQAEEMLRRLGLADEQLDKRPQALAGGEKQRVAIGRALIKRPDLCFADEPTASLDWDNGRTAAGLLRDAARAGAAVLMITHDARLRQFADRVHYLHDGRLHDRPPCEGALEAVAADGDRLDAFQGVSP